MKSNMRAEKDLVRLFECTCLSETYLLAYTISTTYQTSTDTGRNCSVVRAIQYRIEGSLVRDSPRHCVVSLSKKLVGWDGNTPDRRQSITLLTNADQKSLENNVFDCHLPPVGRQIEIENCFKQFFIYPKFVDSMTAFDCRPSGMV